MYSELITNQQLDKIQETLYNEAKEANKTPLELKEYSVEEVQLAIDHINNLINLDKYLETAKKSKSKVVLEFKNKAAADEYNSQEIQDFIQNEVTISQWNCPYWMERYYWISNIENKFILYNPLLPQRIWMRIFAKLEELKRAIRLLCLKARQTSMTTFAQGVVQHRIQFFSDVKSLIASKSEGDTRKMSNMVLNSMYRQPFWLRPKLEEYQSGDFFVFDNGSLLDLGWGTTKTLGARGHTPTVFHGSEIASYKYPYEAIEDALIRAMHETVWLLQIFEGTAEGRDDWFHKKVKETIAAMEKMISSLFFVFVPYFARRDIYPTETWMEARKEAFYSWVPSLDTIVHAKKCENSVKSNSYLREEFGSNWKMPREQMFWYELEKEAAKRENRLNTFLQEIPADWEEAFQHAGRTIFPVEILDYHSSNAQGRIPDVYKLRGDETEISPILFPTEDEIDTSRPSIVIKSNWNPAIPASYYELVPVIFNGWDSFDAKNKILIWEHPRKNSKYGSIVDPSDGLGEGISDLAAIEGIRKGTVEEKDAQVFEFVSPEILPMKLWPFIMALWTYYSPIEQLLGCVEANMGYEIHLLIKENFPILY